ncbi:MAG: type II toxin-antitoxin system HipA family toxin [Bdellovibrionaceae bacterium]|nr:type II toxin-antitoxin system HipA family toxin [Pseudobdellovibrionaceae bacterium]
MTETLDVFFEKDLVGRIREESEGLSFQYDVNWTSNPKSFAISASLPLSGNFAPHAAKRFFANFLPEGDVRAAITRKLGISISNDFSLLKEIGGDCAGALEIRPQGSHFHRDGDFYRGLSLAKIWETWKSGADVFATYNRDGDIRLSLAGAQDKLPVYYRDGKLYLPQAGAPSSHILKLPSRHFKYLPENECLSGWLAAGLLADVADIELLTHEKTHFALIARYDRANIDNSLKRLHQEDFCQALGFSHQSKYENDNGPDISRVFDFLSERSDNVTQDIASLIDWLIFNVAIGNCDNHAKNISLLMTSPNHWRLAPFYDLVSTRVYKSISKNLAFSIGGSRDSGTITGTHWSRLAESIQVSPKLVHQRVEYVLEILQANFPTVQRTFKEIHGPSPALSLVRGVLDSQSKRLLSQLRK